MRETIDASLIGGEGRCREVDLWRNIASNLTPARDLAQDRYFDFQIKSPQRVSSLSATHTSISDHIKYAKLLDLASVVESEARLLQLCLKELLYFWSVFCGAQYLTRACLILICCAFIVSRSSSCSINRARFSRRAFESTKFESPLIH